MKVTLIIPTYNSERYIDDLIASIRRIQWYEIIFVDDGSVDRTMEVLKVFAKSSSSIKILRGRHRGVSESRNIGLSHAKGNYVMFMDSDDVLEPAVFFKFLKRSDLYYNSDIILFTHTTNKQYKWELTESVRQKLIGNMLKLPRILKHEMFILDPGPCSRLYKRSVLIENHLKFDTQVKFGEDLLFNIEAINSASVFTIVPDCIYLYRYNVQSVSRGLKYDQVTNAKVFFEHLTTIIDEEMLSERRALSFIRNIKKSMYFGQPKGEQNKLVEYYRNYSMNINDFNIFQKIFFRLSIGRHFGMVWALIKVKDLFIKNKKIEFTKI